MSMRSVQQWMHSLARLPHARVRWALIAVLALWATAHWVWVPGSATADKTSYDQMVKRRLWAPAPDPSIVVVDIDEAAVQATGLNAQANGVTLRAGLPELAKGPYQTVLANILATPLKVLAPLLCAHVAPGGALVLAGILERQAEELQAAYAPYCQLSVADAQEGWILMTAQF